MIAPNTTGNVLSGARRAHFERYLHEETSILT
jgi:hypothetical protein